MDSSPATSFKVVVLGASAGGMGALCRILTRMDLPPKSAVFIVIHMVKENVADQALTYCDSQTVAFANDGDLVRAVRIFVARPGMHLGFENGRVHLSRAPKEHYWKPSIDWAMRSAASVFRERAVGVILTGQLFDGAAGLAAISEAGGTTIVQSSQDAEYPEMPMAALATTSVDFNLPAEEIGEKLNQISAQLRSKRSAKRFRTTLL